jgi:CheY-like chemotaxis protein
LLAGRKLLLADDSITIQKVVDLTFSDEGAHVLCVDNGRDAIDVLEKFNPDVVLADVFMPEVNGYEVCEYIKQNEKLKHIPVMLLVGSFEPFDEEEARRVGANEILTKPFQSIRRLLDKVGLMVGNRPSEEQIPTAELPKSDDAPEPVVEKLSTAELEITTADTQPLPPELKHVVAESSVSTAAKQEINQVTEQPASYEVAGEELLELDGVGAGGAVLDDDFVLDIDLDEVPEPSPSEPAFPSFSFRRRATSQFADTLSFAGTNGSSTAVAEVESPANTDELVTEAPRPQVAEVMPEPAAPLEAPASMSAAMPVNAGELSPEMIDAIARRAVEHMSEKVVQEIAWEVVPQLAELLIKRQLEEKNS